MRTRKILLVLALLSAAIFTVGAAPHTVENTVKTWADWEDDYTDTDQLKGFLAVRCSSFEGFKGEVEISLKGKTGGRKVIVTLSPENGYLANVELGIETYCVESISADSDGRIFDCSADPGEIRIKAGQTSLCMVNIAPGSIYRVPYEDDTVNSGEVKAITGQKKELDNQPQKVEPITEETAAEQEERHDKTGFQVLVLVSILFAAVNFIGVLYVLKKNREE